MEPKQTFGKICFYQLTAIETEIFTHLQHESGYGCVCCGAVVVVVEYGIVGDKRVAFAESQGDRYLSKLDKR